MLTIQLRQANHSAKKKIILNSLSLWLTVDNYIAPYQVHLDVN